MNLKRVVLICMWPACLALFLTACNNAGHQSAETGDTIYGVNSSDSAGNLNQTRFGPNSSKLQSADDLVAIYSSTLFCIKLSQDALTHDISSETKTTATNLLKVQTDFNKELKQLAEELGVNLPDDIDKDQKKELEDLKQKKGPKYEQNYYNLLLFQQKKALRTLKSAQNSNNDTIINWAKENTQKAENFIDQITTGQKHADSLDVNPGT